MIEAPRQRSQSPAKPAPGLYDAVIALWLMAALLFPANYVGRTQDNRVMTYDATGNLLTVTEPDASKAGKADVGYTYDALKRQLTETSGGLTHQYRYDLAGNRISVLYGGLSVPLISAYDAQNRLSTLTQGPLVTTYAYDLDGNILTKTLPNGDATTSTFDAANRTMTLVSTRGSGGLPLSSYTYAYDPAANVKQVTEAYANASMDRVVTNTYDAINRLTQEAVTGSGAGTTLYSYDNAHNRETMTKGGVLTSYSYNSRNQLTSFTEGSTRTVSYTYDNNGNRLTRTEGINTDTFTWDNENRLIALAKTSLGGSGTYGWGYDYRTRRVELAYNATVTKAVFSGGTEVREFENGLPSVDYVRGSDWGGGVGGILYTERAGVPSFTHYNRRGDVTAKTDATGNITYQATYEAFGKRVTETGATLDRQKSNTKDEDVPGYANEGFRFRDLETGAFLSKDPAGFVDGPNLYAYVRQNPWTGFDPDGLKKITIVGGPKAKPDAEHDNANDNYLKAAVRNAKHEKQQLKKAGSTEGVELIIYGPSYDERAKNDGSKDNLKKYVDAAKKAGIEVKVVKSASEVLRETTDAASKEAVSSLSYYGHSNAQNLLLNYGEHTIQGSDEFATETINASQLISALPKGNVTKNFQANLGGCNLGNTRAQNSLYGQDNSPSMAEEMSSFYGRSTIMGSAGKSSYAPIGQGYISPSSEGGYNYWKGGAVTKSDPPGQRPSSTANVTVGQLP